MDKQGIVMLGGGGHAAACFDVINSFRDYSISCGGRIHVTEVISDTRELSDNDWNGVLSRHSKFILGVGQIHNPKLRMEIVDYIDTKGGDFLTLISPFATVSPDCTIGTGTVVMPGAVIRAGAKIGEFCIINTSSIVEHGATVGDWSHISTGAVVNGDCYVGDRCFVGSNAVLLNQINIGDDVSVGAGSVVTKHLNGKIIFVGNPASFLRIKDD